jgi:hypothetical protein
MSYYDYRASLQLAAEDPPFYALIMAAMRKADTDNLAKLQIAFPETWRELSARYHSRGEISASGALVRPAGLLPGEAWHETAETEAGT